jgi:ATP-binding cassette, subfamily C, bacterial LapB
MANPSETSETLLQGLIRSLWPQYRELAFLSLFINFLALAVPIFVLQVYDRVVFFAGISTLQALVFGVALAIAFDFVLRQARSRVLQRASVRVDATLSARLYDKLSRLSLRDLERSNGARWQVLQQDVARVRNTLGGVPVVLAVDVPFALLFLALIAVIALPILWVVLLAVPVFVFVAVLSSRAAVRSAHREQDSQIARDTSISEFIHGRTTLKSLNLSPQVQQKLELEQAETIDAALERGRQNDTFSNLGLALALLTTVAITAVGAIAILDQAITIGALIATNMLANRLIAPLNQLVGTWRTWSAFQMAQRRLEEVFALPDERDRTAVAMVRPEGVLAVENATFRYDTGEPVLRGVNFTLRPGGLHGIVGRSGSGKSTLIKMMQGLYLPESGRVLIDGADIGQYARSDLAKWIGYAPQETFLLSGSIRDNIARRDHPDTDAEVVRAAKFAGAHEFIVDLPEGYGTDVGEAGSRLSGGQRQRLAIARAVFGDPPILLLDEPTANIDRPAEEQLQTVLLDMARDHNVVVVTHSPVLLGACENILVLERGQIAAAGPGADILPRLFGTEGRPVPLEQKT